MAYKYTVPASNGKIKYKLKTKKGEILSWTSYGDYVVFVSKVRQTELDKKKDVIVEKIEG